MRDCADGAQSAKLGAALGNHRIVPKAFVDVSQKLAPCRLLGNFKPPGALLFSVFMHELCTEGLTCNFPKMSQIVYNR